MTFTLNHGSTSGKSSICICPASSSASCSHSLHAATSSASILDSFPTSIQNTGWSKSVMHIALTNLYNFLFFGFAKMTLTCAPFGNPFKYSFNSLFFIFFKRNPLQRYPGRRFGSFPYIKSSKFICPSTLAAASFSFAIRSFLYSLYFFRYS